MKKLDNVEEWLRQCNETYQRELSNLLAEHSGEFVAINGKLIIEVASDEQYLFEKYLNLDERVEIFSIGYERGNEQDYGLILPNRQL